MNTMRLRRNSDADLRALERAVRADPHNLSAHVKLLREKIRAGLLSQDRLVMAARLGHPAARDAAPEWVQFGEISLVRIGDLDVHYVDLRRTVINVLTHLDRREAVSFACDCAEHVLGIFESRRPEDKRPRLAIEAVRTWVSHPSPKNRMLCDIAARNAEAAATVGSFSYQTSVRFAARSASRSAASVTSEDLEILLRVIRYAYYAYLNTYHQDGGSVAVEQAWQQARVAQYLIGEAVIPTVRLGPWP